MMSAVHRYLLMMRHDRSYVIPDKAAEIYLTAAGYARYQKPNLPFVVLTSKGIQYGKDNRKWLKTGRTAQ